MALGFLKTAVLAVGVGMGMGLPPQAHGNTVGLITVSDGPVEVVRGGARFDAREGMALQAQDIVRTLPGARMARLETSQGAAIDLGPGTQLLLYPATTPWPGERSALAYLAMGWAKLSAGASSGAADTSATGLATASVHVAPSALGVVLVQAQADGVASASNIFAFVESGGAQLSEYAATPPGKKSNPSKTVPVALAEGQAYRRSSAQSSGNLPGDLLARASAAQLSQVPPSLKDSLPRRAARFSPATAPQPAYLSLQGVDLAVWAQVAEPLRTHLARRFAMPVPEHSAASASKPLDSATTALRPAAVRKVAWAPVRAKPQRSAAAAPRSKPAPVQSMAGGSALSGVAMLLERDASAPASINATKPGEATARTALPETNTRIPESSVPLPALQALPSLATAPAAAAQAPAPQTTAAPARGRSTGLPSGR
jgi:hypothetical protein